MEFTHKFNELKSLFSLSREVNYIENSNIEIRIQHFISNASLSFPFEDEFDSFNPEQVVALGDKSIKENESFSYPVFTPRSDSKSDKAIILLHGLNEKSWHKYLPWAYYLSEKTKRPVILFPISFHMNRCPESWANPRVMIPLLNQRQKTVKVDKATFANVALSQRLTDEPLRFFTSGRQSAEDIVSLLKTIKDSHQLNHKAMIYPIRKISPFYPNKLKNKPKERLHDQHSQKSYERDTGSSSSLKKGSIHMKAI